MIVWFVDRFGLPGHYHRIWVRLLRDNYVPTSDVRVISLHAVMKRTLLHKHGTRKAPSWIPDEGPNIARTMAAIIEELKPKAVVLAAPESLACLGLHPDFATLHNLRGSVYWRSGVPHLVMLPMSAWNALVSQKEIGAANYGFESADEFTSSRQQGQISSEGNDSSSIADRLQGNGRDGSVGGTRQLPPADGYDDDADESESELEDDSDLGDNRDRDLGGSSTEIDRDEGEVDQFFYEPVLSPVGRFVLTADTQKLARILRDGQNAAGPARPIEVNWR